MADIHILDISVNPGQVVGSARYVLHIPTNATQTIRDKAVNDPSISGFESQVPEIDPAELTLIRSANLVEEVYTMNVHKDDPAAQLLERIRDKRAERVIRVPPEFAHSYKWYLDEYSQE